MLGWAFYLSWVILGIVNCCWLYLCLCEELTVKDIGYSIIAAVTTLWPIFFLFLMISYGESKPILRTKYYGTKNVIDRSRKP